MKIRLALIVPAAVLAVAACSGAPAHVTRAECHTQLTAWQQGPARPVAISIADHLTSMDFKAAVPEALKLESMPMPACADPHGYWMQLLKHVAAMGNNEELGIGGLVAQSQEINDLSGKLSAELGKTAGYTP